MELISLLAGLDPAGPEAMVLCAAAAAALGGLIGGGFVLYWRDKRAARRPLSGRADGRGPTELGLLALWRLNGARGGALGRGRATPPTTWTT